MQSKKNTSTNIQISSRKAVGSRAGSQSSQQVSQQSTNNNNNALKEREDALIGIVKDYLEKCGYPRTLQTFKN